jgi:protein SCO1/2
VNAPAAARPLWKNPWFIGAVAGVLLLTGLRACQSRKLQPLPKLSEVPAFSLTRHDGTPFGSADLENRVYLVSFFFTSCQTICPDIMRSMQTIQRRLASHPASNRIHLVSISVDPEYDTPAVLTDWAARSKVNLDRWHLLTGPRADIEALVVGGFRTAMGEKEETSPGLIDISHSMKLVLVDRTGWVRHYFSAESEKDLELAAAYALEYATEEVEP